MSAQPIDLILFCPACGAQHIDAPEPENGWDNPPHRSHLCHECGHVWRPADVPTNGVASLKTRGERDGDPAPRWLTIANSIVEGERERTVAALARVAELERLLNTPEVDDFMRGVPLEAAHQRAKWGTEHDAGKTPEDWLFLVGYLAGKACRNFAMASALFELADTLPGSARGTLREKAERAMRKGLHHIVTTAAACANWHLYATGADTRMRPGIQPPEGDGETGAA